MLLKSQYRQTKSRLNVSDGFFICLNTDLNQFSRFYIFKNF